MSMAIAANANDNFVYPDNRFREMLTTGSRMQLFDWMANAIQDPRICLILNGCILALMCQHPEMLGFELVREAKQLMEEHQVIICP